MTGIFLRATVVTRGWNRYRNKSQHRKSTLEKKILPPFQQGFKPATFQSRVRCSNHWAIPAPRWWWWWWWWLLLYSAILPSWAHSLHSHVILREWLAFYSAFLNIHQSGVLTALAWLVPHETDAVSACSVYTIQRDGWATITCYILYPLQNFSRVKILRWFWKGPLTETKPSGPRYVSPTSKAFEPHIFNWTKVPCVYVYKRITNAC